jgi:autotransporter-associated beta strand protein
VALQSQQVLRRSIEASGVCEALENRILFNTTTIDWKTVNQTISGFGASSAWSTQGVSASQQQLLFSSTNGAGISLLRSRINEDNSTLAPNEPQAAGSYEVDTMQQAAAMGVTVWSTPWNPPAAWKTNQSTDNGGSLLTGTDPTTGITYYQEYANYLAQYVVTMKGYGIPIYGISLQNEPDATEGYDSCTWTAAEFANFLPDVVSAFSAYGVSGTKIIMPEETGWHFELANTVMNTPALDADVSIYAGHDYDGGSGPVPGAAGKQLWMTEVYDGNNADTGILSGLWVAQNIYSMVVNSGVSGYDYWWIQAGTGSGNGALLGGNWGETQLFWGLANYSKFIRPGWNNIGETNDGGLTSSAYADTATGQFATVLINTSASPITENIDLNGAYSPVLTPWVTSSTLNLAQQTPIPATGNGSTFTYTIPAQSIVTLTGNASSTPVTAPPVGLSVAPSGTTGMVLSWSNNDTGATGYTVQRSTDDANWTTLSSNVSSGTYTYSDSSLSVNSLYYYRVIANNGSVYSNLSYAMTLPISPSNLTASYNLSTMAVTLNWTLSSTSKVDYEVDRSTDGGATWTELNSGLNNSTTSYVDSAPPQQAAVEYRVEAIYGANASLPMTQTVATSLQPPTGLTVKASSGGATLNWTNSPASIGASTIVQQSINGSSNWTTVTTVSSGMSTYTDPTATASGTTYSYRLQATLSGSVSSYSATVSITINTVAGTVVQLNPANGNNTFYLKKDGDGLHLDIWENSAAPGLGTPTQQAVISSTAEISITGGTAANTLTIDYANGDPFPSNGISFSGTAGINSTTISKIPTGESVIVKDSLLKLNSDGFYFTDLQSLTLGFGAVASTLQSTLPLVTPILTTQIGYGSTLTLATSNSLPVSTIFNVSSGGVLNLNGQSESIDQLTGAGTVNSSGGTLSVGASNGSSAFSGVITGSLSLDKIGGGTFTLSGTNAYSGSTIVNSGGLSVNGGVLGTIGATIYIAPGDSDNGTLSISGSAVVNASFIFDGCDGFDNAGGGIGYLNQSGGTLDDNGAIWLGGASSVFDGADGNYFLSSGVANLAGGINMSINQNSDSNLTVSGGLLNILDNSSIQMGSFYSPPATFTETGGTVTFFKDNGATVGGTGALILGGGGGDALTANLDGGTLIVPGITSTSGTPVLNLNGGTLEAAAPSTNFIQSRITTYVQPDGLIFNSDGNVVTINQPLIHSGPGVDGGLIVNDTAATPGTLTLDAAESYTGATTITRGTLELSYNPGDTSNGTLAAGTTVNVDRGGTLLLSVEDALGFSGGSLAALNIDGGTVTTTNVANTTPVQDSGGTSFRVTLPPLVFSGGTLSSGTNNQGDIYGGSYLIGNVVTLPSSTTSVINAYSLSVSTPATFNVGAGTTTAGVDLQVSSIIKTWAPVSTGLIKIGAGVMELTGSNAYTNDTLISAGTLQLGDGQTGYGSVIGNITDNGMLTFANQGAQSFAGIISGIGGLIKTGAGILTLTSTSTYTGSTNISAGTFALSGTGSISGSTTALSVGTGAAFSYLPATPGTLGFATGSTLTLASNSTLDLAFGDKIAVTGAAAVSSTVNLVLSGTPTSHSTYTLLSAGSGLGTSLEYKVTGVSNGFSDTLSDSGTAVQLTVTVATTTAVSSNSSTSTYGHPVTFTATITSTSGSGETGTVQFQIDGSDVGSAMNLSNGTATFSTSTLGVGTHSIVAVYSGDGTFGGSSSFTFTQTVNKEPVVVTANNRTKTYGQVESFGMDSTAFTSSGLVNGEIIGSVTLTASGGTAANAGVGTYALTPSAATGGTFNGSDYTITYIAGTLTVNAATLMVISNGDSKTYGQIKTYGPGSTAFTTSGLQNSETIGSVTITASGGTAANASIGSYTLTPSAATGGTFNSANYSITYFAGTLAVNKATLTVTATGINRPYDGTTSATVSLSDNRLNGDLLNESYGSAAFSSSDAGTNKTVSVSGISISGADAADYALASTTATTTANITRAVTTTVVSSSNSSAGYGSIVTLTATVTPTTGSGETGSVEFQVDGSNLSSGTIIGNVAVFNTSSLSAGTHSIVAIYSGDGNFGPSTSAALNQLVVVSPVTLALTGSSYLELDASVAGQLDVWAGASNSGLPANTYPLNEVSSINVAGTAGNDTLTINFSNGDPLAAVTPGVTFDSTGPIGGNDSIIVIGDNDGDTYSASSGQILVSGGAGATAFNAIPIRFANAAAESILAGAGPDALSLIGAGPVNYVAPFGGTYPTAALSTLSIAAGSKVVFQSPSDTRALLELGTAANWAGQLDLQSNDMLIHGGPAAFATISSLLGSGYNLGGWTGEGIVSSTAATDASYITTLGAILNAQGGTPLFNSGKQFDGLVPASTDVLVKYTYYGDADLNGEVDGTDYSRIDSGYINHLTGWYNGDFNYDGAVDGSDYTLIDNAFNRQGSDLAADVATAQAVVDVAPSLNAISSSPQVRWSPVSISQVAKPASLIAGVGPSMSRDRTGSIATEATPAASVAPTIWSTSEIGRYLRHARRALPPKTGTLYGQPDSVEQIDPIKLL